MIVKVKNDFNLLIFNLFNGNAFLTIVILYYLLIRRDVWFANHLVMLFKEFFHNGSGGKSDKSGGGKTMSSKVRSPYPSGAIHSTHESSYMCIMRDTQYYNAL